MRIDDLHDIACFDKLVDLIRFSSLILLSKIDICFGSVVSNIILSLFLKKEIPF